MAVVTLEGKQLDSCDLEFFQYKSFYLIIVTGSFPNVCGHALLNVGGRGGYYVHIAGWNKQPHLMTQAQYETYLHAFKKEELLRKPMTLSFPDRTLHFLEKTLADRWQWLGLAHNCATFVERALRAGGSHFSFIGNCPVFAPLGLEQLD